jgi:hypothetical protein
MDAVGWYIATIHDLMGHDTAAAFIGAPAGDKSQCAICRYERTRSEEDRRLVLALLAPDSA